MTQNDLAAKFYEIRDRLKRDMGDQYDELVSAFVFELARVADLRHKGDIIAAALELMKTPKRAEVRARWLVAAMVEIADERNATADLSTRLERSAPELVWDKLRAEYEVACWKRKGGAR